MITQQHTQEALSLAFVHALSGVAGLNLELGRRHDYGVDGTFRAVTIRDNRRIESGVLVDFQLKASTNWRFDGGEVVYDLEVKNYNDLVTRDPEFATFLLVLLCLPKEQPAWMLSDEANLVLKHCCYWAQVTGPVSSNTTTKRIRIPRANLLTPMAMTAILASERAKRLGH